MAVVLNLFRHDLRRMAPWLVGYYALLTWRAATYTLSTSVRQGSSLSLMLYFGLLLLIGVLVLENPLFNRRAFWRSRPITPLHLLQARWLFAAVLLWVPWLLAQWACMSHLGLDHRGLVALVLGDGALTTAVVLSTFLALASLCSKPYHLLAPLFLAFGGPPFVQMLPMNVRSPYLPTVLQFGLVAAGLLFVSVLATVAIYQRRIRWAAPLLGAWVLSSLAPIPLAGLLANAVHPSSLPAPEGLGLSVVPASDPTVLHTGNHFFVSAALEPHGLAPDLGLQIVGVQGDLIAESGEVFSLASPSLDRVNCVLPRAVLDAAPDLDQADLTLGGCRNRLELPLIERLGREAPTSGTLELRVRLRTFEAELQQVDPLPGNGVRVDERYFRVQGFEEVAIEDSAAPGVRIHLAGFRPIGRKADHRGFGLTSRHNPMVLFDRRLGIVFDVNHGTSRSWGEDINPLTPFYRLRVEHLDTGLRHTPTPGALPEPKALPEGAFPYKLLALERRFSETFEVTVRVEDYVLTDFLGRLAD